MESINYHSPNPFIAVYNAVLSASASKLELARTVPCVTGAGGYKN